MEGKFTKIYQKNIWGGGSGTGSKMTADNFWYLDLLTNVIEDNKVIKVADIGCGDFNVLKNLDWNGLGIEYNGMDCVEDLILHNNQEYGNEFIKFNKLDISESPHLVQDYDLVILKDVIQHWNNDTIELVLHQLVQNNKLVLIGNGYKFGRTPEKNNWETRDINNKYSYHPVDIDKEPLKSMNLNVVLKEERRYKQYCLIK
jgi:2-polyprenyl-3-methyl-5-hydroxy-6-metoxy-1,4-benzoquinol methylase|tara:strand:- start:1004 stop:1606 length:603 start_codon:yes stop_codon:yes gene_type:complete